MTPLRDWLLFHAAIGVMLALEWAVRRRISSPHRRAVVATALWTGAALAFGLLLWRSEGHTLATQFFAGFAMEEALSVDNLFVFLLLFGAFRIPFDRQGKVLFWGVLGAIVLRGSFILAGLRLLEHFAWLQYLFGALLLFAALRLLVPEKKDAAGGSAALPRWLGWLTRIHPLSTDTSRFFARDGERQDGRRLPTLLLLALVAVELTDVLFALDSIPAVLSLTRDLFVAYTSNILAVMGLRSLYILLAASLRRLRFLHFGLAAILAFAALRMLADRWLTVGPLVSLGVILGLLAATVGASLLIPGPPAQSA